MSAALSIAREGGERRAGFGCSYWHMLNFRDAHEFVYVSGNLIDCDVTDAA